MEIDHTKEDKKRKPGVAPPASQNPHSLEDWSRFPEVEDKVKQFLVNLKAATDNKQLSDFKPGEYTLDHSNVSNSDQLSLLQRLSSNNPSSKTAELLKRSVDLSFLLSEQHQSTTNSAAGSTGGASVQKETLFLQERTTAIQDETKNITISDLIKKEKRPPTIHVKDFDEFIFIIVLSEVTFTLFAIEKQPIVDIPASTTAQQSTSDLKVNFLTQVKMQFQVIYQEQSHSRRLTCCEVAFYYEEDLSPNNNNPSICFLIGGDIGEIFILKDSAESGFSITRRQVCTGEIQSISAPIQNRFFKCENVCLVLSQLEHIYLMNFTKGTIIAQFGNQGSSGPGKFLSLAWHPSYEYFVSSRENGGIELWKIDSTIAAHVTEAYYSTKLPGKFFRKYIDMPFYYNWGIHVNQTGPLVFSSLLEHVLVTIDNLMVLRFTLLEIKNNESHINILTVNLKIPLSEVVNIFTHNIELFIVTTKKIYLFSLSEKEKCNVEAKVIPYSPENMKYLFVTSDFKYIIALKDSSIFLNSQVIPFDSNSTIQKEIK